MSGGFFSNQPNDHVGLSQILEATSPRKYWLSPTAAAGILRRAKKRGRTLPAQLEAALTALASQHPAEEEKTTTT
jgi:hypothetical protein